MSTESLICLYGPSACGKTRLLYAMEQVLSGTGVLRIGAEAIIREELWRSAMQKALLDEIKKLSISERILLVEEIWDGIVDAEGANLSLSEDQRTELDRRIEVYQEQPEAGRSWQEIQEEYRRDGR